MTNDAVLPMAVGAPLAVAALLMVAAHGRRQRAAGPVAAATGAGVAAALGWLTTRIGDGPVVHWFGGWRPLDGIVPGIPFVGGPVSVPLAALVAALVAVALIYSQRYFEDTKLPYHVLMLTFLAGMLGFVLTGDAFNLFIFYELVGVSAYALTGYVVRHEGPLQGAINFAVSNTVGSLLLLSGVVFLYVATGTPNLAAAGEAIRSGPPNTAVLAAFVLVTVGCFVKAAVVPFHFWHADAHAVAPTPVCAIFAGIMIQLGVFVFARLHWVVFEGLWRPHAGAMRALLLTVAVLTAVVAAVMTVLQTNVKRLLAFSSVAHTGVGLVGVALLTSTAFAGTAIYLLSHAFVKAALFLLVGIVLDRLGTVDEQELHGRGRRLPGSGAFFAVGGVALAGLPPFGLGLGKELIDKAAAHHGVGWLTIPVLIVVGGLTGGAVLRVAARVFLGWGVRAEDDAGGEDGDGDGEGEEEQTEQDERGTPVLLVAPPIILIVAGLLVGAVPTVAELAQAAARWFTQPARYVSVVLGTRSPGVEVAPAVWFTTKGLLAAGASTAVAIVVGSLGLWGPMLGRRHADRGERSPHPAVAALRAGHSGHVGDYVAWMLAGLAVFGGLSALALGS